MPNSHAQDVGRNLRIITTVVAVIATPLTGVHALTISPSTTSPRCRDGVSRGSQIRMSNDDGKSTTHIDIDDDKCFRAETRGDVSVTDDDADLRLGRDSYALIMEEVGGTETMLEVRTDDSGRESRTFSVNGQTRPAAEGTAWLHANLLRFLRQSGFAADERVARIWRQGGAAAVVHEVDQIPAEGIKRIYLTAMLERGQLSRDDLRQVTGRVARFKSDGEKRLVLDQVADQHNAAMEDIIDATQSISSDGEKRLVLSRVLDRTSLDAHDVALLIDETHDMESDGERRLVLSAAADRVPLDDPGVRSSFFGSVDRMRSDGERRLVLMSAMNRNRLEPATLAALLHSASRMDSDGEKALVLVSATEQAAFRDPSVRAAFDDAAKTISSRGEYDRVMRAAGR